MTRDQLSARYWRARKIGNRAEALRLHKLMAAMVRDALKRETPPG